MKWWKGYYEQLRKATSLDKDSLQLHKIRERALQAFDSQGIPSSELEEWKYTNIAGLLKGELGLPQTDGVVSGELEASLRQLCSEEPDSYRIVVYQGGVLDVYSTIESLPKGIKITRLGAELRAAANPGIAAEIERLFFDSSQYDGQPFVALNTALHRDAIYIHLNEGAVCDKPLQVVYVTTAGAQNNATFPRLMVVAQPESEVTILESYRSLSQNSNGRECCNLICAVTQLELAERAQIKHIRMQQEHSEACFVGITQARQASSSKLSSITLHTGGKVVRNEIRPILQGTGIDTLLYGITAIGNEQHVDNHLVIDHAAPHCFSREVFKGVYGGKAKGVFSGTIIVRQDAQKTNAVQSNNTLLISENASIETRPQLKIFADDVKCTHGATIGQLDENALFYLRSRGIPEHRAREILIRAFLEDVLEGWESTPAIEHLRRALNLQLNSLIARSAD